MIIKLYEEEPYFTFDSMEKIKAEADSYNCDVVIATHMQLMLDIDEPYTGNYPTNERFLNLLNMLDTRVNTVEHWASKGGNTHIVINLRVSVSPSEQIALQAIGGSDPKREYAALQCLFAGSPHPVLLFKPRE